MIIRTINRLILLAGWLLLGSENSIAWTGNVRSFGATLNAGTDGGQTFHGGVPFGRYFNSFSEDSSATWAQMQPNGGDFNGGTISGTLADYNYARSKGFPYRWNFALSNYYPSWVNALSPADAKLAWHGWLAAVAAVMPSPDFITVYNEPIHSGGTPQNLVAALGGNGATGWDWLIQAFRDVQGFFPSAKLGVNEWGSELTTDSAHPQYLGLLKALQQAGVLGYYGLESYFGPGFPNGDSTTTDQMTAGLNDFAAQVPNVPIFITELTSSDSSLGLYQAMLQADLNSPYVQGISFWNPDYEGAGFGSDAMNWMIANVPLPLTGASPAPTPTVSPTVTPSPSPTVSPSPLPSMTPSASPSPTPSPAPSVPSTPTPSPTLSPTPTPVEISPTPTPESTPPRHHRHQWDFDDFLSLWKQFLSWLESR